ncbi:MAG TPA: YciI family protein [Chloroflexota bacterium]
MRFLTVFSAVEREGPPDAEEVAQMGKLIGEMAAAGVLQTTEGCQSTALGARVRRSGGRVGVTDGPFSEAKEVVGGFAILEVASKAEAIEWTKRFLAVAGDGEAEIRQLYDEPAFDASASTR